MDAVHRLVVILIVELLPVFLLGADGNSNGSPNQTSVCDLLLPVHGSSVPQVSNSPYEVLVNGIPGDKSHDATQNLTVSISGRDGQTFTGFLLQARQYTSESLYTTIGSFNTPSGTKQTCLGSSVTHTSSTPLNSIEFTWTPPINATGLVQFRGSVVYDYATFWELRSSNSSNVSESTSASLPSTLNPPSGSPPSDIDTSNCGTTKGCYLVNCDDPNSASCEYGVTWTPSEEGGTAFELFGSGSDPTPYITLGLSHDVKMGDDSVTDCNCNPATGNVDVQMSWNNGLSNTVLTDKYLSLVNGSTSGYLINGLVVCRFTRHTYPPSNATRSRGGKAGDQVFYPGTDLYHLMIVKGPVTSGSKGMHVGTAISPTKLNLTAFIESSGSVGVSPLVKAHGIMMIFAWMVFAGFGMIVPRYYKTAWPGKKWSGKPIWFQLHQPILGISVALTGIAFILIFVEAKGYSTLNGPAVAHAPLGIIVMALVLLNPIMAHFRPDPKDKTRWIFNICHFCVGLLSHIAATTAIFLSLYISSLGMPDWCIGVMIFYICWHACVEIILAIHMHRAQRKIKKREEKKTEVNLDDSNREIDSPAPIELPPQEPAKPSFVEKYSVFRSVLAGLHLAGVIGCSIALSVQIGSS